MLPLLYHSIAVKRWEHHFSPLTLYPTKAGAQTNKCSGAPRTRTGVCEHMFLGAPTLAVTPKGHGRHSEGFN